MPIQTTYTKEFSPELAGNRVGWTSVEELPSNAEAVGVNVVVATVSEGGAKLGYHPLEGEESGRAYSNKSHEGFVAVSGLFMIFAHENSGPLSRDFQYRTNQSSGDAGHILLTGGSGYPDLVPDEDSLEWCDNADELLAHLKDGLTSKDIQEAYPYVYYLLNGLMGHEQSRSRAESRDMDPAKLFVVDSAMHDATDEQAKLAYGIVSKLDRVHDEDTLMRQRLSVFSDVPAADIPMTFQASRRSVAEREKSIRESAAKLYAPQLVYLSIGFRPNGRTWPYMDPESEDEIKAFGMELRCLQDKNTAHPIRELDREIAELELRRKYAGQGNLVLRQLEVAERAS